MWGKDVQNYNRKHNLHLKEQQIMKQNKVKLNTVRDSNKNKLLHRNFGSEKHS